MNATGSIVKGPSPIIILVGWGRLDSRSYLGPTHSALRLQDPTIVQRCTPSSSPPHSSPTPQAAQGLQGHALFICLHTPSSAYSCRCVGLDRLPEILWDMGAFLPVAWPLSLVVMGQ